MSTEKSRLLNIFTKYVLLNQNCIFFIKNYIRNV